MDEKDRMILNVLQEGLPVTSRPYLQIGETLGMTEEETLIRVRRLRDEGFIRRIGPVIDRKSLGYVSTLCGARVSEEYIEAVAEAINEDSGVTHNYERDGELNLWFTITKKSAEEINCFIAGIEGKFNLRIYRFPEKKLFKIRTYFPA